MSARAGSGRRRAPGRSHGAPPGGMELDAVVEGDGRGHVRGRLPLRAAPAQRWPSASRRSKFQENSFRDGNRALGRAVRRPAEPDPPRVPRAARAEPATTRRGRGTGARTRREAAAAEPRDDLDDRRADEEQHATTAAADRRERDRPPAAVADDAGDARRVTGREHALEPLLQAVDREQERPGESRRARRTSAGASRRAGRGTREAGEERPEATASNSTTHGASEF